MTDYFLKIKSGFDKMFDNPVKPNRDIIIIIAIFIICLVCIAIYSFNLFKKTNTREFFVDVTKEEVSVPKINRQLLKDTLDKLQIENKLYESSIRIKYIDPSI